jgi:hypothetical protein
VDSDAVTSPASDPLASFLRELGRLSVDDLAMVALPEPDPDERAGLLQRAVDAAGAAGRREALAVAPGRARDALFRSYSRRGYDPTWFGLNWGRSLGRADDRARLVAAVEDAAVASIVADLLSADDIAALREPFEIAASMAGAGPDTNSGTQGSLRGRPLAIAAFVIGVFMAIVTGAFAIAGAVLAAAAILTRARPSRRTGK